jgi:isoleucyl-tRNA synthetase
LIKVKEAVSKKLEEARANKEIGLSLEAKVMLFAEGEEYEFLKANEAILAEIFIVSAVEIKENRRNEDEEVGLGVKVEKASGEKCERCWMYSETVGEDKENPTICHRCSENLQ